MSSSQAGGFEKWAFARLSTDERERAKCFKDPIGRARYAIVRAALRQLLGRYTDRDPSQIRFAYGPAGKPRLADAAVHFNVSHSDGLAIVALARSTAVGVDVERRRTPFRAAELVNRLFHTEEKEQLTALPASDLPAAVLRCWTIKEAVGKATGFGLDEMLRDVVVDADPTALPRVLRLGRNRAPEQWSFNQLSLMDDRAVVAVAVPAPGVSFEPIRGFHPRSGTGHPAPTT